MQVDHRLTRRTLLKSAAVSAPLLGIGAAGMLAARKKAPLGMNVVVFLTDQERKTLHFPRGWEERNLPGLTRLKRHGLSFENAFTNACMCSPARATWLTGYLPAQHGVRYTLEEDMPAGEYPQVETPTELKNIATVAAAAGYQVVYKGKWHLSKPEGAEWGPSDLERYGFHRWNPPDSGANQDIEQAGGGVTDHDGRCINDDGDLETGHEGVLAYLRSQALAQQPFFLIISLVNPHDVLFYPTVYQEAGYDDSWLEGEIDLPATVGEELDNKPSVQRQFLLLSQALGPLPTPEMKRKYLNFYGNLLKASDNYLVQVLDTLEELGLRNDTLVIRTADHGEMGLTHGGQRQKNFNCYEEAMRVPLVFSNPKLYRKAYRSNALVSHVDFLPTLAGLFGLPKAEKANWQGADYSRLVLNPTSGGKVQDYVVFTYDDYQSGQKTGPYPTPPNRIVAIREGRYKIAEYYDADGQVPSQWEMYDLKKDPLETRNLAHNIGRRSKSIRAEFSRLRRRLRAVREKRLRPLA
ncbi:MAG: sulfatase-like hydrolase/transferase [Armatimonadota bacterium]